MLLGHTVPNGPIMQQLGHRFGNVVLNEYSVVDGNRYSHDLDYREYYQHPCIAASIILYDWYLDSPYTQQKAVYELNPNQVILNSVVPDAIDVLRYVTNMETTLSAIGIYHYCAVLDGKDIDNFVYCAMLLRAIPGVDSFGIRAETALRIANGDRSALVRAIAGFNVDIHLLDNLDTMTDVCDKWLCTNPRVIGVSGQKLIDLGYNNIVVPYAPTFPSVNAYVDWSSVGRDLTSDQKTSIQTNIINWNRSTQ